MATAKQLASLKKARAARAKNLGKKTSVKTGVKRTLKKVAGKRTVKKTAVRTAPKFVVQVKTRGNKIGYLSGTGVLDTDKQCALLMTENSAERNATNFFNTFKKHLLWVKVLPAKK